MSTTTPGYITDKQALLTRLRRIEGQVRGLEQQIENETYCVEILTQVAAATRALEGVALMLLDQHLQHCLIHAADPAERDERLAEASQAIARLVRA